MIEGNIDAPGKTFLSLVLFGGPSH